MATSNSVSSQFTYSNASYSPTPFHLKQPYIGPTLPVSVPPAVSAPAVPVVPSVYPSAGVYPIPQYQQAQQLFQKDAQMITPEALEGVKAALASSDVEQKVEAKKKAVPRKAAGQAWEDPTLADWPETALPHPLMADSSSTTIHTPPLAPDAASPPSPPTDPTPPPEYVAAPSQDSSSAPTLFSVITSAVITNHIKVVLDHDLSNFTTWRCLFTVTAGKFKVLDHLQRSTPPASTSVDGWSHLDYIVLSWIYTTIDVELLEELQGSQSTAFDTWSALDRMYRENQQSRIITLDCRFRSSRMNPDQSVTGFCKSVKKIADELTSLGNPVSDETLVLQILRGLPDTYGYMYNVIPLQRPFPTYTEARQMLQREEERKLLMKDRDPPPAATPSSPLALATADSPQPRPPSPHHHRFGGRGGCGSAQRGRGNYRGGRGGRGYKGGRSNYPRYYYGGDYSGLYPPPPAYWLQHPPPPWLRPPQPGAGLLGPGGARNGRRHPHPGQTIPALLQSRLQHSRHNLLQYRSANQPIHGFFTPAQDHTCLLA